MLIILFKRELMIVVMGLCIVSYIPFYLFVLGVVLTPFAGIGVCLYFCLRGKHRKLPVSIVLTAEMLEDKKTDEECSICFC